MKEERPWGWYEVIDQGDRFKVKNIEVNQVIVYHFKSIIIEQSIGLL